jgi:uncharacterized protein (TIGR00290 family)
MISLYRVLSTKMTKAYLNWSSGKDSALALYYACQKKQYRIDKLLTTINKETERISMHGVRVDLLIQQINKIGLPVDVVELSSDTGMNDYNRKMTEATIALKAEGFTQSIFGDIFLKDLKKYREEQLQKVGIEAVFPLWKKNTKFLIEEFIELGFKAIVVCTNSKYLEDSFCGRIIDDNFLKDLPDNVDPCGENGEFHTFVFDGPIFSSPVKFEIGEKVKRSYKPAKKSDDCFQNDHHAWDTDFCFCDLIPK